MFILVPPLNHRTSASGPRTSSSIEKQINTFDGGIASNTSMRRTGTWVIAALFICTGVGIAHAQRKSKDKMAGYDRAARATLVHPAIVYTTANDDAQHIAQVDPGHEVVVIERNGAWVRVFANTDTPDEQDESATPEFSTEDAPEPASGWIHDKGIVTPTTANGDAILFGTAANLEDEAAQPHAPKDAAEEAHLLYRRVAEYFPDSPLAAKAMFRSADVRWQIDKADISTLPSAKEQEAYLRPQLYEGEMKQVMKLYPKSDYAALAAYDLLDNKLCGDWQGLPKCPEMEAGLYEKYADRYPDSPKAAEALYNATYREGVLVEMYQVGEERKRSEAAIANTQALANELKQRYPQSDYATRAASIAYRVAQQIPVYGNDRD
jgi:outer membrane protein assembly factor BamD (BamD/ComL family)